MSVACKIANRGKLGDTSAAESTTFLLTWENSDGNSSDPCASVYCPAAVDCRVGDVRHGVSRASWFPFHLSFHRKWSSRKREESSSVVGVWNSDPYEAGNTRKLPDGLSDHEQS